MKKNTLTYLIIALVVVLVGYATYNGSPAEDARDGQATSMPADGVVPGEGDTFSVTPISHATMVLQFGGMTIFNDPTGGAEAFAAHGTPELVLLSDIHGDHLDADTLSAVLGDATMFVAPQAVIDELPADLASRATALANDEDLTYAGLRITAMPMYNLPEGDPDNRHVKGRGNGYLLEDESGMRVYIAGDTEDIPEMRQLEDIDVAFIPMNPPYTMPVEAAADAVIEFGPATVYPYHYRTPDGLSDVEEFKRLVNEGNPDVEVLLLDWYPDAE